MSKKAQLIRNIFIIIIFILLYMSAYQASYSSNELFRRNEKSYAYGPSTIIQVDKLDNKKVYYAKYDKWHSYTSIRKGFLGMWYIEHYHIQNDNRIDRSIDHTFSEGFNSDDVTRDLMVMGMINDELVSKVHLELYATPKSYDLLKEMFELNVIGEIEKTSDVKGDEVYFVIEPNYIDHERFMFFMQYTKEARVYKSRLIAYDISGEVVFEHDYQ